MRHVLVMAEVLRRIRVGGGHQIPPRPATRDMIQRGEFPRHMIGVVIGRAGGGDQPYPLRHRSQSGQQGHRVEAGHGVGAAQRLDGHVQQRQMVGHEEGIELARLQLLRQPRQAGEIEIRIRPSARVAPSPGVDGNGAHESAQMQLPPGSHTALLFTIRRDMGRRAAQKNRTRQKTHLYDTSRSAGPERLSH